VRDDVPAMLSNGEYVIRKDAVKTIGEPILKKINNLTVNEDDINRVNNIRGREDLFSIATYDQVGSASSPNSFKGLFKQEFQYLDKNGELAPITKDKNGNSLQYPVKGRMMYNRNLSTFALTDENNPLNSVRENRETILSSYLEEKKSYDQQKKDAMKAFKKAKTQRLIGAAISAVSQIGGSALNGDFASKSIPPAGAQTASQYTRAIGNEPGSYGGQNFNFGRYAVGGPIKANSGNNVDKIPALLTGGEFVVNRQAVKSYGVDFFDRVNKFADGGLVGKEATSNVGTNDTIERLIISIDNLASNKNGTTPINEASNPDQNIVTVNVTVNNGSVTSETKAESKKENKEDNIAKSKEFGEAIKVAVLREILKQQKDGGLLPKKV
jgi:hypothetical protein